MKKTYFREFYVVTDRKIIDFCRTLKLAYEKVRFYELSYSDVTLVVGVGIERGDEVERISYGLTTNDAAEAFRNHIDNYSKFFDD